MYCCKNEFTKNLDIYSILHDCDSEIYHENIL